jgi:hypothetical protein
MATTTKKPAAKKAPAKKPAAKKAAPAKKAAVKKAAPAAVKAATPNVKPAPMKPIAKPLGKQGLLAHLAESAAVELKAVKAVIANLEATIHKKGARGFVWPGLFKATLVSTPARPARKGINPFTKQEQMFAAKPASAKIRIRALKKANEAIK